MTDERIIVVDENDHIIGTKPRAEVDHNDIYRVAALWLTDSDGQILLAQRSLAKQKNPGKWGPAAAGTIDEGETYEANIYKEAEEEIGLSGVKFMIGPKIFVDERDRSRHFTQWFSGHVDWPVEKFRLQTDEVKRIAWVTVEGFTTDVARNPEKYVASARHWPKMFLA